MASQAQSEIRISTPETGRVNLPKTIDKLSQLAQGKVINDKSLGIDGALKENVLVYAPHNIQTKKDDSKFVWILGTPEFFDAGSVQFFELRKRLGIKYKLSHTVKTTKSVIRALYENSNDENQNITQLQEDDDNEYKEYYRKMLQHALIENVSDIHIEKRSTRSVIRMRKHGQLVVYDEPSNSFADKLCRIIYTIFAYSKSILFRAEEELQQGAINSTINGEDVKLRYQSITAYPGGYDVILRVLPIGSDEEKIQPLENPGYAPSQVSDLLEIASKPQGALTIAGTTGSGKSTTLKNLIMIINSGRNYTAKIFTLEDPAEYKIPGVTQISIARRDEDSPNSVSPFEMPIKGIMRADPDVIMVGEVRDDFTADALKKLTQSGHQLLTTVHSTSALGITERYSDFGINRASLSSPEFLSGLIYQKLLPLLCPHCSIPFSEVIKSSKATKKDTELAKRLEKVCNLEEDVVKIRGKGCEKCKEMGIVGRTVCAEVIMLNYALWKQLRSDNITDAIYHWRSQSDHDRDSENMTGKTALEHAIFKMRKGLVSPHDIENLMDKVDFSYNSWQQLKQEYEKNK